MQEQNILLHLLIQREELFYGALGHWQEEQVNFELRLETKAYHGQLFPIPRVHKETMKKRGSAFSGNRIIETHPGT